ncbi:MAG: methyltransferase domain-containing protein [Candidatus Abyssobacteria bacterium SURF_17]|uniref:Methyltransferase domain-containing protein n=1 Tax=Candidatus Abyssobacteria bacterium SURF_17 TaxID=2093361 RepID=A0A419EQ92_9BACT|nr:MAG: methyltransferase domain-containing protein [Candidatus Abyssubacteria bacterium SURF_17]
MVEDAFVENVMALYRGPAGVLYELLMTEHIHPGGVEDTKVLAEKAGIRKGLKVLDVGSALGGPARYLARKYGCSVTGLDATDSMLEEASRRNRAAGLEDLIELKLGNALDMPFEDGTFDIVWGQDAWCYISDKERLINECARVIKPQGILAFTDWLETEIFDPMEKEMVLAMLVMPNLQTFSGYLTLLKENGFQILEQEDLNDDFVSHTRDYQTQMEGDLKAQIIEKFGEDLYPGAKAAIDMLASAVQGSKMSRGRFIARKI